MVSLGEECASIWHRAHEAGNGMFCPGRNSSGANELLPADILSPIDNGRPLADRIEAVWAPLVDFCRKR